MDADEGIAFPTASGEPVKVKVCEPFRIVHEGKPYVGRDVLSVPSSKTLYRWLQGGWVERLPAPKPKGTK